MQTALAIAGQFCITKKAAACLLIHAATFLLWLVPHVKAMDEGNFQYRKINFVFMQSKSTETLNM